MHSSAPPHNKRRVVRASRPSGVRMAPRRCGAPLALVLWCAATAAAEVTIRDPGTFVVDQAGVMTSADRAKVEGWLRELEQKTGAQVKILTAASTDGEDAFQFGHRHAELWKLGRKGKDNGALIVLIPKSSHQRGHIFVHTGYGLESIMPDSWCGSLSRSIRDRYFRAGRYSAGLTQMAGSIANRVAKAAGVTLSGVPVVRYQPRHGD